MTKDKTRLALFAAGALAGYFAYRRRWSIAHNVLAHSLIVVAEDAGWQKRFHDWTGERWKEKG